MWLYHKTQAAEGKLFKPSPDAARLHELKRQGWVDSPAKFDEPEPAADPAEPETVAAPLTGETAGATPAATTTKKSAGKGAKKAATAAANPIDIQTVPTDEALVMVGKLSDRVVLEKIRAREAARSVPKGGRKKLLAAIDAKLKS